MLSVKKLLLRTLKFTFILYIIICISLYFFQEKIIFAPEKLDKDHVFSFTQPFEEINTRTPDNNLLNGLLFRSDSTKGLVFYLHGNAGSLNDWGEVASRYTSLRYDIFILDYPGYGKSTGAIKSQAQLFQDIQTVYDEIKKKYPENKIVIIGYSIGTGPAAQLASVNHPRLLILQAPYYSLSDLMRRNYPIIPLFLLKYKFQTNQYLQTCKMPVVIFHGNRDEIIYYGSSLKLKQEMKGGDTLITLNNQSHNGITDNLQYITAIKEILK